MSLFWIFGIYGVALILMLTTLFWKWSGMASIGAFGLISFGSLLMIGISIINFKKKNVSVYHKFSLYASISFLILIIGTFLFANLIRG